MDELRWFLLFLGLPVVVGGVFVYSRWQDWRQDGPPWRRRRRARREPFADEGLDDDLRGDLDELDGLIAAQRSEASSEVDDGVVGPSRPVGGEPEPRQTPEAEPEPEPPPQPARQPQQERLFDPEPAPGAPREVDPVPGDDAGQPDDRNGASTAAASDEAAGSQAGWRALSGAFQSRMREALRGDGDGSEAPSPGNDTPAEATAPPDGEEKLIVLTVMAPEDAVFAGEALISVLDECGLRYGEHRIYHRTLETQQGTVSLYSVANVVEPGCLDADHMEDYTTPGVALFMQLPGPFDGLAAFEQMLHTARTLSERLGGELLDGRRCTLTQQSIEHLREELVEYRRRARLAARRAR
jgi:cell division protein ZipA